MTPHPIRQPEAEAPHFYLWLNGEARRGISTTYRVTNPYNHALVATVSIAGRRQIREAVQSAEKAHVELRAMSRFERAELLLKMVQGFHDARTEIVDALILEGGKPRTFAEQEFERTIATFTWAAEEATRFCGEQIPMDGMARGKGYEGYTLRRPIGIIFGITPFNFPLNLVAHKVAPAFACGNAIIIKPASNTPISALIMARIASESGAPAGSLNVLPMRHQDVPLLLMDERIKMLSFTGSAETGWALKKIARKQRVTLELGGNSGSYVDVSADLDRAAERLALGGFAQAGQSCIAVQRIYVHQDVYDTFTKRLVTAARATKAGDPRDADTVTGPLISARDVDRVLAWIEEAVADGAVIACGGKRLSEGCGQIIEPTVLTHVHDAMLVCCREVFAPLVTVTPVQDTDEAIRRINDSPFGLQAAVFSHDLRTISRATEDIEAGGIVINDFPTLRIDHMPYGGTKDSGLGREGIRSAMLEMSEEKMIVLRRPD
ncbi:MAG: aldehyde dehydrogenase family protein [Mariprofundaceae bacterium]|nr:aldehyde dehydrogenase family protein [Mariprofundaceae bacterium]